jgi:phosphoglucosamine mutase
MGGRLFGTDGVRGLANSDLTPDLALRLATAAAQELGASRGASSSALGVLDQPTRAMHAARSRLQSPTRPVAVVGRDPRASGEMLEAAVAAGLASAGVDVLLLGVLPTPAVAFLTADLGADLGVVISASHNAMPDNGIKIVGAGGRKLADAVEDSIEKRMAQPGPLPTGDGVGRIRPAKDADRRYLDHLLVATPNPLRGLRVVVDCAHGAASELAP